MVVFALSCAAFYFDNCLASAKQLSFARKGRYSQTTYKQVYSTVTDLARLRGWSTLLPLAVVT